METEVTEIVSADVALTAQHKGEMDTQIATAKKYPRSVKEFLNTANELACIDEETAESMWYTLRRSGKKIEGPSVRMAEVVAYAWNNLRCDANIEEIGDRYVTAVATVADLERNNAYRVRTKRRITKRDGTRYGDDMIQVACNAAMSIAFREAVFKAVPRGFVKKLYDKARATAIGTEATLAQRRGAMIEWFKQKGADEKEIYKSLGRKGLEEVTLDDLADLKGMATAIKEGSLSIADAFADEPEEGEKVDSNLTKKLKKVYPSKEKAEKKSSEEPQENMFAEGSSEG